MTRSSPQTGPKADRGHNRAGRFIAIYMRLSDVSRRIAAQESDLQRWSDEDARPTCSGGRTAGGGRSAGIRTPGPGATRAGRNGTGSWRTSTRAGSRRSSAGGWTAWARPARSWSSCSSIWPPARVNFISLQDHLDLSTASGRRMAGVLGSIALYETEVRAQRILAGQEAARRAASGGAGRRRAGGSRSRPNWRRRSSASGPRGGRSATSPGRRA